MELFCFYIFMHHLYVSVYYSFKNSRGLFPIRLLSLTANLAGLRRFTLHSSTFTFTQNGQSSYQSILSTVLSFQHLPITSLSFFQNILSTPHVPQTHAYVFPTPPDTRHTHTNLHIKCTNHQIVSQKEIKIHFLSLLSTFYL